jgi:crotonobetainyl-CoA:carnitine CoA-transferase CaiB-like acyl-CoA transferase
MGLGYRALAALHPALVYVSISGFGTSRRRPYSDWPAYAPVAEAMAGLYEPIRRPGEPPPVVVAGALGDNASALYALIGTLAALRQRERTGRGQHVDIAMFDAMVAMTDMVPFMWSIGEPPSAATAGRTGIVAAFAASDGHFVIAIFATTSSRSSRSSSASPAGSATRASPRARAGPTTASRWCGPPWRRGRAASRSSRRRGCSPRRGSRRSEQSRSDLYQDPHVAARDMLIEVPRADGGDPMLVCGNPVKLSGRPKVRSRRCRASASTPRRCCAIRSRSTTPSSPRCVAKE